jgi:NAD(P)H-hydrate epimerase
VCYCLYLRFLSPEIAGKYGLDLPEYGGIEQVVELGPSGQKL